MRPRLRCRLTETVLIIIILHIYSIKATRKALFRNTTYNWSRKYFSSFTTYLNNSSIYTDLNSTRTLNVGLKSNLAFQIRLKDSKHYQTLFSFTLDICNMLSSIKDTMFKRWFRSVSKYGNFAQSCPILSGHYYINGWKLDSNLIPSYLYAGDYRVKGHVFYSKNNRKLEDVVIDMEVEATLT